jgi:ATP-dependent DNA helicase RecG
MKESETIEFKKSLAELGDGLNSIAAILNKHGAGELWFGIKNDGTPSGMDVTETTLRKVSQAIAAHIEPKIYPDVSTVALQGKSCIRVAFAGNEKPYYAHGRAYMRVADEDRQLSAREIESIILRKNRNHRGWDSEPITTPAFKPDAAKIRSYVRKAGLPWTNALSALESLGLRTDGHYLNAARVFFAKPPLLTLRCAVFATPSTATIIDQHDFHGDILTLIEEAEKYILKNIRIGMKLDGLVRVDVPEIDREAFREAIINAFCHRDYRDPDEVRIAIFPDRVEVRNPGTLMEGVTLRTLKTAKVSRRRNPLIADLLRRIQYIEAWGRGIPLILAKAPNVRFSQVAGIFITEFPRPSANENGQSRPESGAQSGAHSGAQSGAQSGVESVGQSSQVLNLLLNGPLSANELANRLKLETKTGAFKRAIKELLDDGLIEYTLPDKPNSRLQKYRLTTKGHAAFHGSSPPG